MYCMHICMYVCMHVCTYCTVRANECMALLWDLSTIISWPAITPSLFLFLFLVLFSLKGWRGAAYLSGGTGPVTQRISALFPGGPRYPSELLTVNSVSKYPTVIN